LCETSSEDGYYDEEVEHWRSLPPECSVMSNPPDPLDPNDASPKPVIIDTPEEFSWKNHDGRDWTTPAKDQGRCGSCWLFAAVGVLESIINIREGCAELDPDLSEQYVLSCLPAAGSCSGGSPYKAFLYIKDTSRAGNYCNGIIPESYFPYQADDEIPCSDKHADWKDSLIPILDFGYWVPDGASEDIEAIKTQVMQTGPVATYMYVTEDFKEWIKTNHNPDDYYPYNGSVSGVNHVVVIVGWKDDPSISNGGYWICKNSWGKYVGYNGFFNIEYGSLNIDRYRIVWADYDPSSVHWAPKADAGGPYSGDVDKEIIFDGSKSCNPEGNIVSYHWDFGDGTTDTGVVVKHTYSHRGIYPVTLTITDENGRKSMDSTAALVDLWLMGDTWRYSIDDIAITLNKSGRTFSLHGSIKNLVLTVTNDTDGLYKVNFKGKIKGGFEASFNTMTLKGHLKRRTMLTGSMVLRQSDLGIKELTTMINGSLVVSAGWIRIPLPFRLTLETNFNEVCTLLDFPLHEGKEWHIPCGSISVDGEIKSIWLHILNFINKIAELNGQSLFPPEITKLLPIVDIGDILEELGTGNIFYLPAIPHVKCIDEKEITVEAGTFNAYHISGPMGGNYYYSPDAGNIIKMSLEIGDYLSLHGELNSTNYTP
jgi:PKD repeat protein